MRCRATPLRFYDTAEVFEQDRQMVRIGGRRNEIEVLVETRASSSFACTAKARKPAISAAWNVRNTASFNNPLPTSLALPGDGDRQTREQHDRNGMAGEPFGQALRSVRVFDLTVNERVIIGYLGVCQGDIGL